MPSRNSLFACCLLLALAGASAAQTVIHAGGWVKPDGTLEATPVFVTVRDGKITAVSDSKPNGGTVQAFPDGVLAPGLIDLSGAVGALGGRSEDGQPMEPSAKAGDALNRFQHESSAESNSSCSDRHETQCTHIWDHVTTFCESEM